MLLERESSAPKQRIVARWRDVVNKHEVPEFYSNSTITFKHHEPDGPGLGQDN